MFYTMKQRRVTQINNDYTIVAVQKALRVLKLFNTDQQYLSLTEISNLSGHNKSSTLRILATLQDENFVRYNEETRKYRLGIELFKLGNVVIESLNIKNVAEPYLREAVKESGLIAHLGILDNNKVVVIDKIWPSGYSDTLRMVSRIGGIVPAYCTGVGKVLMSFTDEKTRKKVLDNEEFIKYSDTTITDSDELMLELMKVKSQGFACNNGEHEPYLECLTYPIYDYSKKVVAAMSLTGLKQMVDEMDENKIHNILRKTTKKISEQLGYKI
ncbi:MAG: IclR family transcriptional regulator [Eubacteriales bacterium]